MNVKHAAGCVVLILACASAFAQKSGPHWQPGGIDGVTRANYTVTSTNGRHGDEGTIVLPHANTVYLLPLSVQTFAESQDFTLLPGGTLMVNATGLYRVAICLDWKGQDDKDIDLRYIGIGRIPVGATLTGKNDGGLLDINGTLFDRLAVADLVGTDTPAHARASVAWAPGVLAPGQSVTRSVTLAQAGVVAPGDTVTASLTSMSDALLGAQGNAALDISARIIGPDTVRVVVENRRGTSAVSIPAGTLNVLASSTTLARGESADAWTVLQTPTVLLYAGEQVFGIWKSRTPGDYLQTTNQTYVQIERWK
jgi:hypothetical protein